MPVDDLPVPYHPQDSALYCGPACAGMVLEHLGTSVPAQSDLYADQCHDNSVETGWATSPNGLQVTLNERRPTSFPGSFSVAALPGVDAISRKIVWTIHHHRAAAVALIQGGAHWIVVRGFEASAAPAASNDGSYTISSFDVNDPSEGLTADQNIAYATWQSTYMRGVSVGHWQNLCVAVCDSDPAPLATGRQAPAPERLSGERIMPQADARAAALAALRSSGLAEREAWKKSLLKTTPGTPVLVERLDRPDTFYYIVPMEVSPGVATVLVCLDARFGGYLQAARSADGAVAISHLSHDPNTALDRVLGRQFDLGRDGRLRVRKEAYALYTTLVWRPCRESMSPYRPFYMVTVGARRVYVRVDGEVFTKLHVNDRGI